MELRHKFELEGGSHGEASAKLAKFVGMVLIDRLEDFPARSWMFSSFWIMSDEDTPTNLHEGVLCFRLLDPFGNAHLEVGEHRKTFPACFAGLPELVEVRECFSFSDISKDFSFVGL